MILVGLTGGIASGKSTVSRTLHDVYGATIIDCDSIVRDLQEPGRPCVLDIQAKWPECVDTKTLALKREVLSDKVFNDPAARRALAKIMNTRVFWAITKAILRHWWRCKKGDVVILDAPLLFETNIFTKLVSCSVVVACNEKNQLERLMLRNAFSLEQATQRVRSQMKLEDKVRLAHYVIGNDASTRDLESEIGAAHKWLKLKYNDVWCSKLTAIVAGAGVSIALSAASLVWLFTKVVK